MEVFCSFCELSFSEHTQIVKRGSYAVCADCVSIVKEIFAEFETSETYEGGGVCTICGKHHSDFNKVFKGKKVHICNTCLIDIEDELTEMKQSEPEDFISNKSEIKDDIISRVRPEIQQLKAYSVPHYNCSIKLDGNESPFDLSSDIRQKFQDKVNSVLLNRYPDPGADVLRNKLSRMTGLLPDQVVLGNGSDELIEMIIRGFAGGSGKVLIPVPTFSMYKLSSVTLGHEVIESELDEKFDLDLGNFKKHIEEDDPDVIFLASPNNPTGNCFSREKIIQIIESSNGVVVVDEAYCDFSGVAFLDQLSDYPNLIILRTMSKIGFASLRLGMLFASKKITETINKIRLPYNINSLSQAVAETVLDNYETIRSNISTIIAERRRVFERMKIIPGVELFSTDANFILFKINNADRIYRDLIEKDILIRNFNSPGRLENCMRVTIGTQQENDAFLKALTGILSS
ncbi:MAG: histidinol-phosphate transaminase [Candidatus Dadabacteria bacterium]|nr:histidinol-phosphate transaminase [Candidatus Dadabacteria bacterium]NIS08931.1 histidinol-phosphate transaminase [Candidatus Dadabacteria bacterium]NIV40833.1 histidinol-phosphate transaminase [Candidatus Dadabacteria bacterium]NIX15481.1 histidinol-phosphate transaminase [Candidatus Dadabacteria bacterium]NIY22802.1 histidinol-phosphate transaminase [Candidatus Dadabacteria bacterium]